MPLPASDAQLPDQDTGYVSVSHSGQHALLGAESLVSRAPLQEADTGLGQESSMHSHVTGMPADSFGHWQEGRAVEVHLRADQSQWQWVTHPEMHYRAQQYPQGNLYEAGLIPGQFGTALPQAPSGLFGAALPQAVSGQYAAALPYAQPAVLQESAASAGGNFWKRLDAYNAQLQQQQPIHSVSFHPAMHGNMDYYSHPQQQVWAHGCMSDPDMSHQEEQMAAAAATSGSEWPMPAHLVIPSQLQWQAAAGHAPSDLHHTDAGDAANDSAARDHSGQHEPARSESSRTTDTDEEESTDDDSDADDNSDADDEQLELDWASELPSNADEADWRVHHVPSAQCMSRDADADGHEDLLSRHAMRTAKMRPL